MAGACWHDRLFDVLQDMDFVPSKTDPHLWMRPAKDESCYEYIAVYVDDLTIVAKNCIEMTDQLQHKYIFKLKGTVPLTYHLGCAQTRDPDGTLMEDPTQYVEKILELYERTFGSKPKKTMPPLEESDHPELDTSELCNDVQIANMKLSLDNFCGPSLLEKLTLLHLSIHVKIQTSPKNWTYEACPMKFWLSGKTTT